MASEGEHPARTGAAGTVHDGTPSLAAAAARAGGHHVAVLARETVDDWHRRLDDAGTLPARRHLVTVDDTVRSAAADAEGGPQTRPLGDDLLVSVAERPVGPGFVDFLDAALDGAEEGGSLVVDDPGVLADDDAGALPARASAVADSAAAAGVALHVGLPDADAGDDAVAAALWRLFRPADDGVGRRLATGALAHLRETDPTNFGYLRRHWREARRGLEAVGMTYPQAKQVHAAIPDPETTPRTLGAALQAFVTLGALDVWGETVAANRYDLTGYDPERAAAVGEAVDTLAE